MSTYTFETLRYELMQFYEKGEYGQAFALVQAEADQFTEPEQERVLYYWRLCMAARLNETEQALQFFADALARDHWFPPLWLREDPDLKSLQGIAKYEQMVAVCKDRLATVEANVKPELLIVPPEGLQAEQPYPLLIALHGNSGNAREIVEHWSWPTKRGWLLAAPQSSQVIGSDAFIWDDFEQGRREVQAHYTALSQQYAIDEANVLLAGFSMGGGLAVWLALSGAVKARGFVTLGPYLRDVESLTPLLERAKASDLRGYIIVGENDKECLPISRKIAALLNEHGIPCELEIRSGLAHVYPPDLAESLEKAIAFLQA